MKLTLYPAIDLKDGACVRLRRGEMADATVYSDNPGAQARAWQAAGSRWLHVVDLNGAFAGKPVHAAAISTPVIASGGVGDLADIAALRTAAMARGVALDGVIVGRALYDGRVDVAAALALLDG